MTEKQKLELVPSEAFDIKQLWLDPALGDDITDTHLHDVPIGKPRDFFRVHTDKEQRRRCEAYIHKVEGQIETEFYFVAPAMQGLVLDARPCLILPCVYRDGAVRLWPIPFPRSDERDNAAWISARAVARVAIDRWTRLVWVRRSYESRDALPGYADKPDWSKVPDVDELMRLAVGPNGIITSKAHPIYRAMIGAPARVSDDVGDL